MDRCALFVDAGYLLADGAMAVHGTRRRDAVSWDHSRLLELLNSLAIARTQLPMLRCYWYEATPEGRRSPEHDALADIPGLKLRLGRVRPGRREGVDLMAYRDLTTLARTHAICDAVLVSGDEDMVHAVTDAQDCGVRVVGVHVAVDGNWTISRTLRQECDDLIEVAAAQLRPYVNLLHGVDTSSPPLSNGQAPPGPLSNHMHAPAGGARRMRHHSSEERGHSGPQALPSTSSGHGKHHSIPNQMPGHPSGPTHLPQQGDDTTSSDPARNAPQERQPPREPPHSRENRSARDDESPHEPQRGGPEIPQQDPSPPPPAASDQRFPHTGEARQYGQSAQHHARSSQHYGQPPHYNQSPQHYGQPRPHYGQSPAGPRELPAREYESPRDPHGSGELSQPPQRGPRDHERSETSTGPTLSDAVRAAHQEGLHFGESVARDAPALWLEAVLARKPRMPSDLEARLLQGSALPIDFLLHDDVRHSLRRGFWDAVEQSRS